MKIITTVEAFTAALKASIKPPAKSSIPILQCARVTVTNGTGKIGGVITVTDLDLTSQIAFASYVKDGDVADFLIPWRKTLSVLDKETGPLTITYDPPVEIPIEAKNKATPAAEITDAAETETAATEEAAPEPESAPGDEDSDAAPVKTPQTRLEGGESVKFSVGDLEFNLATMHLRNFPVSPDPIPPTLTIDTKPFLVLLNRTRFAISKEESRYTLNAALLKSNGGVICMVTTDGHRLSHATTFGAGEINTLICADALDWLKSKATGTIEIGVGNRNHDETDGGNDWQMFRMEGRTLYARKVTGQFPNYEAVMPRNYQITATTPSSGKLATLITRVAQCADERSGAIKFSFNGSLELAASNSETGTAYALCECLTLGLPDEHESLSIGLNSGYVLDYLKVLGESPVTVKLRDSESAILLSSENWDHVLMPMRM